VSKVADVFDVSVEDVLAWNADVIDEPMGWLKPGTRIKLCSCE
jgi:hypothetical protein